MVHFETDRELNAAIDQFKDYILGETLAVALCDWPRGKSGEAKAGLHSGQMLGVEPFETMVGGHPLKLWVEVS